MRAKLLVWPIAAPVPEAARRADRRGHQRLPQLRGQARDPQALILRSMPARSARGGAARGDPSLPGGGPAKIATMRAPATIRPRHPKPSAAAPLRPRSSAKPCGWRDDGGLDGVDLRRDILPRLQGVPVRVIAEAMGAACRTVRRCAAGYGPHKRHWRALGRLGNVAI